MTKHFGFNKCDFGIRSEISHINYRVEVNSWKKLWKFWNGPICSNKSATSPLLNVAAYWQSGDTEACAKKLSQILVNNTDNGGRGIGHRIYMRYCGFKKKSHSFSKSLNETHGVAEFQVKTLRVEKAFFIDQCLLKVS